MLKAVDHIHAKGYAHRDLKPENILIDENCDLKLVDFGFAAKDTGFMDTILGTPMFMAPEIISGIKYKGKTVDLFALGVILFFMRAGRYPFDEMAKSDDKLYKYICKGRFDLFWKAIIILGKYPKDHFSKEFQELISCMLSYHPSNRLLIADLIGHQWL